MSDTVPSTDDQLQSAVVLAAGEGTRLRPLTANRPKPMLPAGTRPILEHVLNALIEAGVNDLHLVVGYKASRVQSHFGSTYCDVPITYHEQDTQLGSGHALLQARTGPSGSFLLVNGDQIIDSRIVETVIETHAHTGATLAIVEGPQAAQYGAVRLSDGLISELVEQPTVDNFRLFNAGVYAFTDEIFETLDALAVDRGELPLTDAIRQFIADERPVRGVRTDHFWMDATHPWDLLSLSRELLSRGWVEPTAVDTDIYVADSARIHPDATLVGPVVIDADVVVEAGAVVGPYAAISASTTVGAGSILRDTVIDTDSVIGPNMTAIELVTGQDCDIGAAMTVGGGPAELVLEDHVYVGVDLGGVLADRVTVGAGVTLTPGALVGPDTTIEPGVTVGGHIRAGSKVVR